MGKKVGVPDHDILTGLSRLKPGLCLSLSNLIPGLGGKGEERK